MSDGGGTCLGGGPASVLFSHPTQGAIVTEKPESKTESKPKAAARPKVDAAVVITPDGREYRTTEAEAARLVRTAGYTYK